MQATRSIRSSSSMPSGLSDQYVTMVGRDEEKAYRAARLSSYHTADRRRVGPHRRRRAGLELEQRTSAASRSGCATGSSAACTATSLFIATFETRRPRWASSPAAADSGIGCERCHGPGGNHIKAIKGNFADTAIMNAGTGGAQAIGKLCADCHIVGSPAEIK